MGTTRTFSRLESSEDASDFEERAGDSRPDGKFNEAGGPDSVDKVKGKDGGRLLAVREWFGCLEGRDRADYKVKGLSRRLDHFGNIGLKGCCRVVVKKLVLEGCFSKSGGFLQRKGC